MSAHHWRSELLGQLGELDLTQGRVQSQDADLTTSGCGDLIADALDALGLSDVTLVGNDSGGAYSQIAAATRPDRNEEIPDAYSFTPEDQPQALADAIAGFISG